MYLSFFGFRTKPFNLTPDPEFLYLTAVHREALAQLVYAVEQHKGFLLLTGEVGTGKTTLLRALMEQLSSNTACAFVVNSALTFDGILEYMLEDFGIAKPDLSPAQRLITLNNFLTERFRAGQNTVLILDEAQNLDRGTLEQIRLLSNFETPTEKPLQILLVGQPELRDKLETPELRQLNQRIALRYHIPALNPVSTRNYVRSRLRVAGGRDQGLFDDEALARITQYCRGVPRIINAVCDHCLLTAYADQKRRITREIVEEAIAYLEAGKSGRSARARGRRSRHQKPMMNPLRWAVLGASTATVASVATVAILHPEVVPQAVGISTAFFTSLADSVRQVLAR
jgi:general secretion pathway protein A